MCPEARWSCGSVVERGGRVVERRTFGLVDRGSKSHVVDGSRNVE